MPRGSMHRRLYGKQSLRIDEIQRIAKVLGVPPSRFTQPLDEL